MLELQKVSLEIQGDKGFEILKNINLKFYEKKYMLLLVQMAEANRLWPKLLWVSIILPQAKSYLMDKILHL